MTGESKSLGQKHKLDKFYTKPETVALCLNLLDLNKYDCIIEPAAGAGAFFVPTANWFLFDIEPENDYIIKADWLDMDLSFFEKYRKVLVYGNPPFGQQNKLAIKFFNRAAEIADTIAFVLPKSFRKDSIKNKLDLRFHLKGEILLPKNSFTLFGEDYNVDCVFQIWHKKDVLREKHKPNLTSEYFSFVAPEEADFRVQRVGGNAGRASTILEGAISSNYFLKNLSNVDTNIIIDFVSYYPFESIENTVGPKSLPKGELIEALERAII